MIKELIEINYDCLTAVDAIKKAGELLKVNRFCNEKYIDEMILCYEEYGEYIVVDEGIAMPHARPEKGAIKNGFSIVTLKRGINFGHDGNDPVYVVIGLSAKNSQEHMEMIERISNIFDNENIVNDLRSAKSEEDILNIINCEVF